ncbi:MarR family winged helix-turn-helix transcriptional regulator [Pseudooceanicola sp. LIPI14-2-Ac024]|uniref:MarR family winged helix-turn-helix transcriptional regulator n=1 Tax=Pseudooceanicola sp. LIPI14-2-Ac024 TaxID=3344875 RepID=UPI0035CF8B92
MTQTRYRLHEFLGYRLSIASRQQERRLDDGLRELGLTRITWCVLLAVGNEELSQPSEIAQFVGIDRTATSRALRQMEEDGLLARASGRDDRRTRRVTLTDHGRKVLAKGSPIAQDNNDTMARQLTATEQDTLKALLDKLIEGEQKALKRL